MGWHQLTVPATAGVDPPEVSVGAGAEPSRQPGPNSDSTAEPAQDVADSEGPRPSEPAIAADIPRTDTGPDAERPLPQPHGTPGESLIPPSEESFPRQVPTEPTVPPEESFPRAVPAEPIPPTGPQPVPARAVFEVVIRLTPQSNGRVDVAVDGVSVESCQSRPGQGNTCVYQAPDGATVTVIPWDRVWDWGGDLCQGKESPNGCSFTADRSVGFTLYVYLHQEPG
ncbi:MAG: hypothetical protein ACRDTA_27335 [Pseudonocardiaceae bacterium]